MKSRKLVLKESGKITWEANLSELSERDLESLLSIIDGYEAEE